MNAPNLGKTAIMPMFLEEAQPMKPPERRTLRLVAPGGDTYEGTFTVH